MTRLWKFDTIRGWILARDLFVTHADGSRTNVSQEEQNAWLTVFLKDDPQGQYHIGDKAPLTEGEKEHKRYMALKRKAKKALTPR